MSTDAPVDLRWSVVEPWDGVRVHGYFFIQHMFATHDGLSKMYQVSCKELDWLVDKVRNNPNVLGARMMGGGFGGCVISLVKEDDLDGIVKRIKEAYYTKMGIGMNVYITQIEDGTQILA